MNELTVCKKMKGLQVARPTLELIVCNLEQTPTETVAETDGDEWATRWTDEENIYNQNERKEKKEL